MADPAPPPSGPSWTPADVLGSQEPVTPILERPPGVIGDFGPGTLDLSLPSDDALMAAARPNPEQARDRIAVGQPGSIMALAGRFARAGASMDESYDHSQATQQQLGGAFANNGTPVYDYGTHFGALPPDYPDAGTRLHDIATRLTTTADELTTTQNTATTTVTTLLGTLGRQRTAWAGEVDAARNPAGLIPYPAIPGLVARRDGIAAGMQRDVNTAGTTITTAITTYEGHLQAVRTLLGDTGHAGFMYNPFTEFGQTGGEQLRTPIQPGGPLTEIFPDDDGLPRLEGGFTPTPGGPQVLVNVPGPTGPTATDQGQLSDGLPLIGLGTNYNSSGPVLDGDDLPQIIGTLRDAKKGKGNFGIGAGSGELADEAGRAWVGEGSIVASDGKTLVSADGLRQYRPPTFKPNLGRAQANFEERLEPSGRWQSNGHLDIVG